MSLNEIQDEKSLIALVVARGIREDPELAAAEMVKLMQDVARLETELFLLREQLGQLAGGRAGG